MAVETHNTDGWILGLPDPIGPFKFKQHDLTLAAFQTKPTLLAISNPTRQPQVDFLARFIPLANQAQQDCRVHYRGQVVKKGERSQCVFDLLVWGQLACIAFSHFTHAQMPLQMTIGDIFHTVYTSITCCTITIDHVAFVIPEDSTWIISSLARFNQHAQNMFADKFDVILMDPPWPNKSVKRAGTYAQMDIYDLLDLPIPKLLDNKGLVFVWVSNKKRHVDFVRTKLFPKWGLVVVGEWIWLKVAQDGSAGFHIDSLHRKPFELLMIGSRGTAPELPYSRYIAACSSFHSRKPSLSAIVEMYRPGGSKLEMFARQVQQGWTCWGNETIKFNQIGYFEPADSTDDAEDPLL